MSTAGWTVAELGRMLAAREISAVEVADRYLARIEEVDPSVGAFSAVDPGKVMAGAREADALLARGESRGPLHGIPVAVKDLIFVEGLPLNAGSVLYDGFVADQDDAAVARLRAAGAVILGKTNTAEFGFSANQTANTVNGVTRNPRDTERSPGGSSGGSAAAVAAGMAPAALGSDGGGSIRIPSSFCGIAGLKPTFGRVPMYPGCRDPRYPGLSGWESVEHVGPMAQTTADVALMLDAIAGPDSRDRHSLPAPERPYAPALAAARDQGLGDLRVGMAPDWDGTQAVEPEVRDLVARAAAALRAGGASVDPCRLDVPDALSAFAVAVALDTDPRSMRDFLRDRDGSNPRIAAIAGNDWAYLEVADAMRLRKELYLAVARLFDRYDVLLTPTVPVTALELGVEGPETIDGRPVNDRPRAIIGFTYPFNLTGHPAMSVPCGMDSSGLPVGVQVVGDRLREDVVLRVAQAIEAAQGLDDLVEGGIDAAVDSAGGTIP